MQSILDLVDSPRLKPHLSRLRDLYADMDAACEKVVQIYGFQCRGCDDNCCETWFFGHTVAEVLYLVAGCRFLPADGYEQACRRARTALHTAESFHHDMNAYRTMCPLNVNGRCVIYEHRPMLCRLHGARYRFVMPDGRIRREPGCKAFETLARASGSDVVLDRTRFRGEMAELELQIMQTAGLAERVRLSVAEALGRT